MFIKRYVATSAGEALNQIRSELGRDALILSQKKIPARGLKGLFGKRVIEIVAGIDDIQTPIDRTPPSILKPVQQTDVAKDVLPLSKHVQMRENVETASVFHEDLQDIKTLLGALITGETEPIRSNEVTSTMQQLISTGLSQTLLLRYLRGQSEFDSGSTVNQCESLRKFIADVLNNSDAVRPIRLQDRIVALIGSTGVGKTTTIAKLAALARLREHRKVGLLTIDTFRVAAVEQLRTYAEILNVPFAVAHTANELKEQVDAWSTLDLILIDTAGRAFLQEKQVEELKQILSAVSIDVIYLVLSASAREKESQQVATQLASVGYDALLFTKLDETILPSLVLTMSDALHKPLSYFSVGQHVPDDLRGADIPTLQSYFCGGEPLA
ncbi:flagellar biosynthesis protein FlhF [Sulfoacidibacillus ferrooxidans]|uniref:Flagellar biosynthesis protein FlhF n=1 Tax=Sulfoacidibacillus ferrooxidans TaxID=2005001 RepID=A0A9X1VCM4_9BACL|nr:flagellar biosynthesis protein FlhF [Sulfoacidibacillus ferrooxidans]MCI0183607.1 Flagellar biosynthesis protein FlhF [Sulfoacidibacillus ferrooxidans]